MSDASGPGAAAAAADLERLREEARRCEACPLWRYGTQTVFGEGPPRAAMLLVGEQPGDAEDVTGRPFVGPAGQLLDRALAAAGIARDAVYVTNAVKHFKWTLRGKRRIHKTPAQKEIEACLPWLAQEIATVSPRLVVCLGLTAVHALIDRNAKLGDVRGRAIPRREGPPLFATVHPSYILRVPPTSRSGAYEDFIEDLRRAQAFVDAG